MSGSHLLRKREVSDFVIVQQDVFWLLLKFSPALEVVGWPVIGLWSDPKYDAPGPPAKPGLTKRITGRWKTESGRSARHLGNGS